MSRAEVEAEYARARTMLYEYIEAIRRESLIPAKAGIAEVEKTEFITALFTIGHSNNEVLRSADKLAAQADDVALGRLATILEHVTKAVAAGALLARHFDRPTATHTRAARRKAPDKARAVQAEDGDATLAIARPFILEALGANGRVLNRDKLLERVNAALVSTKDREGEPREAIVLRTLSRWVVKIKKGQADSSSC